MLYSKNWYMSEHQKKFSLLLNLVQILKDFFVDYAEILSTRPIGITREVVMRSDMVG